MGYGDEGRLNLRGKAIKLSFSCPLCMLDDAIFVGIGAPGTSLAASAFTTGPAATTAKHRIIDNAGALLYDPDGSGTEAAVRFATLTGVSGTLVNTEFLII